MSVKDPLTFLLTFGAGGAAANQGSRSILRVHRSGESGEEGPYYGSLSYHSSVWVSTVFYILVVTLSTMLITLWRNLQKKFI